MKNIISLLIALSLVFATTSCSKKDDPQPATPTPIDTSGTGATGGVTTISKTIQFYQSTTTTGKYSELYFSKDQNNLTFKSGLNSFKREKSSVCNESSDGYKIPLTSTGRYFYKITTGDSANGYTPTLEGYIDVDQKGNITFKQTNGSGLIYDNCSTPTFTATYN